MISLKNVELSGKHIIFSIPYPMLVGSGDTGRNIALLGTNGLTSTSYTASTSYFLDHPAGAFDGYYYNSLVTINDDAGSRYARGHWMSNTFQLTNQWLQVDFGQSATITALRIYQTGAGGGELGLRQPKDVRVEYSANGADWTIHQTLTLPEPILDTFQTINLVSPMITPRYFRLYCLNTWGAADYMSLGELELLQPA